MKKTALALTLILGTYGTASWAADKEEPVMLERPLWEVGFGAGGIVQPHYPGAGERQTRGLALPYMVYRGDILRIGDGQSARAVAAENSFYELSLSFDAAFDADSEGNDLRRGMPDLDFIFQVGPQLRFNLASRELSDTSSNELQFSLQARGAFSTDFGRIDHRGYVLEPMLRYNHYGLFDPRFALMVSLRPMWATRDLHAYFYDVKPEHTTAFRDQYRADDGYFGTGLHFYGTWHFSEKLRMFLGLQTNWHHGAANEHSPLFEDRQTIGFGLGFIWSVLESRRTVLRP